MSPDIVNLHRVVTFEAPRFPDLGRLYYEAGIGRAVDSLARYLDEQSRQGILRLKHPRAAAEHFFGMISGLPYVFALLGIPAGAFERDERAYLRQAVRLFLDGSRPTR